MATDPNKQRVSIRYLADDGNFYAVVTSRNRAAAVGAQGSLPGEPPLPSKWKPRTTNGYRTEATRDKSVQLVTPSKADAIFFGTASTFNLLPAGTYQITGRTGERRTQAAPSFDGNANPPNERVSIEYFSDNGQFYSYTTTRAHAFAVGATGSSGQPNFPDRWTPRHYGTISVTLAGRDQKLVLVEGNPASATWVSNDAFQFTYPGGNFVSTGRKDENRPNGAPSYVP